MILYGLVLEEAGYIYIYLEKANQGSGGFPGAGCRSKQCLNAVAEYSRNLTLKPRYISTNGKVFLM